MNGLRSVTTKLTSAAAKGPRDSALSDVDHALDAEVTYAVRITMRVFHSLMGKHEVMFPQVKEPIMWPDEEDVMK